MTVNFIDATPGEDAYVYRCEPGSEYGWVVDLEWWDDIDDPVTVKRQRWRLVDETELIIHPSHELCPTCNGDGGVDEPDGWSLVRCQCPTCDGDGRHPLAGDIEEVGGGPVPQVGERLGDPRTSKGRRSQDVRRFSRKSQCGRLLGVFVSRGRDGYTDEEATDLVLRDESPTIGRWEGCRRRCSDLRAAGYLDDADEERGGRIVWKITPQGDAAYRKMIETGWTT